MIENQKLEKLSTDKLIAIVKDIVYESIGYEQILEHVLFMEQAKELYKNLKYVDEPSTIEIPDIVKEVVVNIYKSIIYHKTKISEVLNPIMLSNEKLKLAIENVLEHAVENAKSDAELETCAETIEMFINDINWANNIRKNIYGEDWNVNNNEELNNVKTLHFEEAMEFLMKNEPAMINFYKNIMPLDYNDSINEVYKN